MPIPGPVSSGTNPSLFTSVRTFWRVLISVLHTRLDLFTTELGEEAFRLMYLMIALVVGLFCLHGALFFFMLWVLAALWDTQYRLWVIGGIFLVYLIIAVICGVVARNMIFSRPRFMGQTLDELKRDVAGLQNTLTPEKRR